MTDGFWDAFPLSNLRIKTQRLVLREIHMRDLPAFCKLISSKDVMKYRSIPENDIFVAREHLRWMVSARTNGALYFAIVLPLSISNAESSTTPVAAAMEEGTLIGLAGVPHVPTNQLDFMIDKPYWKQGFMTEVLAALIPVFWQQGLKKVWSEVHLENEASLKVLKKSGFIQVGDIHVRNNVLDSSVKTHENVRMELKNPDGGSEKKGEGEGGDKKDDGSAASSSGHNARG